MNSMTYTMNRFFAIIAAVLIVISSVAFCTDPVSAADNPDAEVQGSEIIAGTGGYRLNQKDFIEWMLATKTLSKVEKQDLQQAKTVIEKAEDESFTEWLYGDQVNFSDARSDKITDLNDVNDALNLRYLQINLDIMRQINQLRSEDENYMFLSPKDGYTNFYFMAVAGTGAVRGAGLFRHALLQVSCENLCFYTKYPVEAWLTEKKYFDHIKTELGIDRVTSTEDIRRIENYADENGYTIGHYTNLFWDADQVMGVGYTPYSNTFCYNASKGSNYTDDRYNRAMRLYSIDEFEALVKEYCEYVGKHDFDDGTVLVRTTCIESGLKEYKCRVCGYSEKREDIATGHEWHDDYCFDKVPTCTEEGEKSIHCEICDEIKPGTSVPVAKASHKYGGWIIVDYPTEERSGLKKRECRICGEVEKQEIPMLTSDNSSYDTDDSGNNYNDQGCDNADGISYEQEDDNHNNEGASVDGDDTGNHSEKTHEKRNKNDSININDIDESETETETEAGSYSDVHQSLVSSRNDDDFSGSRFGLLRLKGTARSESSIRLTWKKVPGADRYVIYGNRCGKLYSYKKLKTIRKGSFVDKKLRRARYYKYVVVALNKDEVVSVSKTVHVTTKGGRGGNYRWIRTRAKKNAVVISMGDKFKLGAKAKGTTGKAGVSRHRKIAYESSDSSIAAVSKKGTIKAMKKGTCYVYAYAQSGLSKQIRVTVK